MKNKDGSVKLSYKMTPLGVIPEDWNVVTCRRACSVIMDGTHFSPSSKEGPFKYITSKNVHNEGLDLSTVGYISKEEHDKIYRRCPVKKGDILLTKDGASTGNCCVNHLDEQISLLSSVAVLRGAELIANTEFILQYLKSPIGQKIIQKAISGQAITRITLKKINAFPILIPPLKEQQSIVNVLSKWDEAIEKTRQLIEQKELRKKALMQQLLTGKKRLKGFSTEWKLTNYGDILRVVTRNIIWDDDASYQLISIRRRSEGVFKRETLMGNQIAVKNLRKVRDGDFVISKMQIVHGASALITKEFDGMFVSGSYITLGPQNHKHLDIRFINWYSKTLKFYHQTFISSYGVHIEKMTFNLEFFLSLEIQLPPIEEQKSIVKILQSAEDEIEIEKHKLEQLKLQKKALMQVLLTGKKRIGTKPNE